MSGMIRIECDNCDETFEVGEHEAGGRVPCPRCGDVNRVPAAAGDSDPVLGASPAAARAASPVARREAPAGRGPSSTLPPEEGPEVEILFLRPAMVRARPLVFALIVLSVAAGVAGAIWGWRRGSASLAWAGLVVLALALVWWSIWYVMHLGESLELSNKRTIHRNGILRRHTNEVLHNHVRNLQIRQSVWQRIVGTGSITLDSAAGGGGAQSAAEITVRDLPRPLEVKAVIDQYRVW